MSIDRRTYAVKTGLDDERDVFFVMGLANAVLSCHVSLHFLEFLSEIEVYNFVIETVRNVPIDAHWGVAALHADAVVQVAADLEAQRVAVVH